MLWNAKNTRGDSKNRKYKAVTLCTISGSVYMYKVISVIGESQQTGGNLPLP